MKFLLFAIAAMLITSCDTQRPLAAASYNQTDKDDFDQTDPLITQSLFNDKTATISEENIQKILDGNYRLPQHLRIAVVKLDNPKYRSHYWNNESYIKTQQSYLDILSNRLKQSGRVNSVTIMPELMLAQPVTLNTMREAAVRMQADLIIVFSSITDVYSKYKFLARNDIKAFATTQALLVDTRTALVPFSFISTKDFLSQKDTSDLDMAETRTRIQSEAVKLTINEVADKLVGFLEKQ